LQTPVKILTVIQARAGSSRLPGKILLPLASKALLLRMVERVAASKLCGTIVVATTTELVDDKVEDLCRSANIPCFRGHPTDLLDRHYQAACYYKADLVLKIPSDCPLIDAAIIDKGIQFYFDHPGEFDYVSNLHPATYPDGNDVEIMTFQALEKAWKEADRDLEREHTTPYIWENPNTFRIGNFSWESGDDFSMSHRWTIDYPEDYHFIERVYDELYPGNPHFGITDILTLLRHNPDIFQLNSNYAGVNWYRNHLSELKTISPEQTKEVT
jgi:spore coat polysaccharide biosynthesis protein SpsF